MLYDQKGAVDAVPAVAAAAAAAGATVVGSERSSCRRCQMQLLKGFNEWPGHPLG